MNKQREQDQKNRELGLQKEGRHRQGRRDQERLEQEKSIDSDEHPAHAQQHRTTPRLRQHQVGPYSRSFISADSLLQDSTPLAREKSDVWIMFKILERGVWRTAQTLHVDSSYPSEVERIAMKYMRKVDHKGI